jgi:hypothetical protein
LWRRARRLLVLEVDFFNDGFAREPDQALGSDFLECDLASLLVDNDQALLAFLLPKLALITVKGELRNLISTGEDNWLDRVIFLFRQFYVQLALLAVYFFTKDLAFD